MRPCSFARPTRPRTPRLVHFVLAPLALLAWAAPGEVSGATGCAPATVSTSTITSDETWTQACSPYIVTTNVTVRDGAVLTIEPGVQVRFNSTRSLTIGTTTLEGGLVAAGTAADPIVFTSNLASPSPGNWRGLVIHRKILADSALTHAVIEYAGVNPSLRLDQVPGSAITISDVEIRQCSSEGVSILGADPILEYITVSCPTATKHGIAATLGSSFVLRHSTISNAMTATDAPTSGGVTDTTFTSYDAGLPFSLHPARVGMVVSGNDLQGATPSSIVNVSAGNITQPAAWPALSYRITGTVNVRGASGPMWTIEAGAHLRFSSGGKLIAAANASNPGGITAVGTPSEPIVFSSNAASPAPGSWNGIQLLDGLLPESRLEHVIIEYTGTGPALDLVRTTAATALLHGAIRHCNGEGVRVDNGDPVLEDWSVDCSAGADVGVLTANAPALTLLGSTVANGMEIAVATAGLVVSGNTFASYDSGRALRLHPGLVAPILAANTLEGASAASAVEVNGGTLAQHVTWPAHTYRILGDLNVHGLAKPVLTLQPGTRVLFAAGKGLFVGVISFMSAGGLYAVGTPAEPIVFGSAAASPGPGDWRGLRFVAAEGASIPSLLDGVRVEHAGSSVFPGIEIYLSDVTIQRSAIESNSKDGITIRQASPTIRESSISNNGDDGIECTISQTTGYRPRLLRNQIVGNAYRGIVCNLALDISGNVITGSAVGVQITGVEPLLRLRNNDLSGNTSKALQNDDAGDGVDARLNWFGTAVTPSTNVQGSALLNPWLGSAPNLALTALEASVSPQSFAPLSNQATIAAVLSEPAAWTLAMKDGGGTTVRSFAGTGSTVVELWDGADGGGVAVPDGTYRLELGASVSGGPTAAAVIGELVISNGLLVAKIDDPAPLEVVPGAVLSVAGTADGAALTSYTLDYALGADPTAASFAQIATGSSPVQSAALGAWNTSGLLGGIYTLRLRAFASGGPTAEDRITVKVLRVVGPDHDDYFSPNGDLVQDTSRITAMATVDTAWVITLRDGASQAIRMLEGEGALIGAAWDGQMTGGGVAPDGAYTYTITVGGGLAEVGGGPTVLDTVAPQASFTSPSPGAAILTYDPVSIEGTAADANLDDFDVSYQVAGAATWSQFASGSSPVTNGLLGQLPGHSATAPSFVDEELTVRLRVGDRAGNASTATLALSPELIAITNVQSPASVIDPYAGQTAPISYQLNRTANVTIELYRSNSWPGAPLLAATFLDGASRTAGTHWEAWDGRDASTGVAPPPNGYYYSIVASDGAGRSARFNDPTAPEIIPGFSGYPSLKINGVPFTFGNFSQNPSELIGEAVDPYRNDEMHIEWTPNVDIRKSLSAQSSGVLVKLSDGTFIPLPVQDALPAGVPANVYWDGRRADGSIVNLPFDLVMLIPRAAEKRLIFIKHDFRIEDARTNPYVFHPTLAGTTNVRYELTEMANVDIDVIDPNGSFLFTLQEVAATPAGVHEVLWDGRDAEGEIVSVEGSYVLEIHATSLVSNQTHTRRVSALVYR